MSSAMAETRPPAPEMKVAPLGKDNVGAAWETISNFFSRIPELGSRYSLEDVRGWLEEGSLQAWGIFDTSGEGLVAVFCTEAVSYPKAKVLRIPYIAGEEMDRWIGFLPSFEGWAREQGFTAIELEGRAGWERVTGYRERFRTFVKELSDG